MISFKGYGRGAALMTTLDAARLVLAVAGSSFVKDSVDTLEGFRELQNVGAGKPSNKRGDVYPTVTLENYLAQMMQRLIAQKNQLPESYQRPPHSEQQSRVNALM